MHQKFKTLSLSRSHLLRSDLWPISFQAPTENVPGCQIDPIQLSSPHLLCPPAITPSTPSSLHPQKRTSTPKPRKPSESKPHPPSLKRKRHRQQNSLRPTDQHTSPPHQVQPNPIQPNAHPHPRPHPSTPTPPNPQQALASISPTTRSPRRTPTGTFALAAPPQDQAQNERRSHQPLPRTGAEHVTAPRELTISLCRRGRPSALELRPRGGCSTRTTQQRKQQQHHHPNPSSNPEPHHR